MSGGVGGEEPRGFPLPIQSPHCRHCSTADAADNRLLGATNPQNGRSIEKQRSYLGQSRLHDSCAKSLCSTNWIRSRCWCLKRLFSSECQQNVPRCTLEYSISGIRKHHPSGNGNPGTTQATSIQARVKRAYRIVPNLAARPGPNFNLTVCRQGSGRALLNQRGKRRQVAQQGPSL